MVISLYYTSKFHYTRISSKVVIYPLLQVVRKCTACVFLLQQTIHVFNTTFKCLVRLLVDIIITSLTAFQSLLVNFLTRLGEIPTAVEISDIGVEEIYKIDTINFFSLMFFSINHC